jgi:hypothetical protein
VWDLVLDLVDGQLDPGRPRWHPPTAVVSADSLDPRPLTVSGRRAGSARDDLLPQPAAGGDGAAGAARGGVAPQPLANAAWAGGRSLRRR